jgi:hypothetical protein
VSWWIGQGADLNINKPKAFSGQVQAMWRFFLAVKGKYATGLQPMREATESALLATLLNSNFAPCCYRKDLASSDPLGQQWVDQDGKNVGWVQEIQYQASFEVNV